MLMHHLDWYVWYIKRLHSCIGIHLHVSLVLQVCYSGTTFDIFLPYCWANTGMYYVTVIHTQYQ